MRELWLKSRWIVVGAVIAGAFAWIVSAFAGREVPNDPLAVAPASANVVARVDVASVTRSHLWNVLLEEDARGVRRIERACGYDPLAQVEEAYVFVTGRGDRPFKHVGFVARGEMARGSDNRRRLVTCVRQVVGGASRGSLREVEIEGERAIASASGRSHAAFIGRDGVVGGDRVIVRSAIRVHHEQEPSAAGDPILRRLWRRVASGRDVVLVARLPDRWLPALSQLADELPGDLAALATLRGVGIGVDVRSGLGLGAALETGSARDAARLRDLVTERIDASLAEPALRLSAAGRALRRVQTEVDGNELVVALQLTTEHVDDLLDLWRQLRAQGDVGPLPDGLRVRGLEPELPTAETIEPTAADGGVGQPSTAP